MDQAPKVKFYDEVYQHTDAISLEAVAKILEREGYGRNNLIGLLREHGVLNQRNLPYQQYINSGHFRAARAYKDNEKLRITPCTMVYNKGLDLIINLFEKLGIKRSER